MIPRLRRILVSGLRRWILFLGITALCLGTLQYLYLFKRNSFNAVPAIVFPASSFHPAPYPDAPHKVEEEGKNDWWHWDTATKFGAVAKNTGGNVGCDTFPKESLEKIQVVLQVGAADDPSRTKAQLASVAKCIDNILIVSDRNYTYGRSKTRQAVDVLASLPVETYLRGEEYAIYEAQQNVSQEDLKQNQESQKLDKYKFLPGIEYAVEQRPSAEWFVFLGSDTFIFWDNIFRLLENYDHTIPYYFGSPSAGKEPPNPKKETYFASGGPGYILSKAAAHRLVDRPKNSVGVTGPRLSDEYKQAIHSDCCGDSVLGFALHDKAGVSISGLWPMFNPHNLANIPFSGTKRSWCQPVISLAQMPAQDMEKLWQWDMKRDRTIRPLLYADLAEYLDLGRFTRREDWEATDWDGYALPDGNAAHKNVLGCEEACQEDKNCYQWTWHARHCQMSRTMRLGHHREPDSEGQDVDKTFTSGWDVDKIRRYKRAHRCADGPHWMKPSVKRRY